MRNQELFTDKKVNDGFMPSEEKMKIIHKGFLELAKSPQDFKVSTSSILKIKSNYRNKMNEYIMSPGILEFYLM